MKPRAAPRHCAQLTSASLIIFLIDAVRPAAGATSLHSVESLYTESPYGSAFLSKDASESPVSVKHGSLGRTVLADLARTPVVQDAPDEHVMKEREGRVHTKEHTFWPPDQGNGLTAWIFAIMFITLIASVPFVLHFCRINAKFSWVLILEGLTLLVWLVTGLLCFTQLVEFSSPHFGNDVRTLTLVEAVYLFAQILTTVGYGDITPAYAGGQAIIACFVLVAIILIAELISELSTIVLERAEKQMAEVIDQASARLGSEEGRTQGAPMKKEENKTWSSVKALIISSTLFASMVIIGTCFFHLYPGEGKTWGQGVYMSIITLTTVGFGAFTAETEAGKVFGSFWMVLGVVSLGYVVTSFTEYMITMREKEGSTDQFDTAAEDVLHMECVDNQGRVNQLGYLRYALLKYHLVPKDELDGLLRQFQALDKDHRGTVSVERVKQMTMSPLHHHHQAHHGLMAHAHDSPGQQHR